MTTYDSAADIDSFQSDIATLSEHLLLNKIGNPPLDYSELLNLESSNWIASLLASSPEEGHQKLAIDYGILAYHFAINSEQHNEAIYKNLLYIITARSGSLPTLTYFDEGLDLLEKKVLSNSDSWLGRELFGERNLYLTEDGDTLSRFQNAVWNGFKEGVDIAISGPTSSGKSHIVKDYLRTRIGDQDGFEAIYLVPTRALISENSSNIRKIIQEVGGESDIKVLTGGTIEANAENVIFVLTPERCLNLLENEEFEPDIIFIDEIQNIGDDNRGVLYEIINSKLSDKWSDTRMVAAGPFLENGKQLLDESTGRNSRSISTEVAPVLQMKTGIKYNEDNSLHMTIFTPSGERRQIDLSHLDHRTWNQARNMKRTLPSLLQEFSENNKSLVYCHKSNLAEQWAEGLSEGRSEVEMSSEAEQIVDFLADRIHPRYPLIKCLKRGLHSITGRYPKWLEML